MPKRIVKGVGMMERYQMQYDAGEPGALEACIKAWDEVMPVAMPDDLPGEALDRENAARCRAILATVGLADLMDGIGAVNLGPLRDRGLDEDSAQWIAAHWLAAYNHMMAQRKKLMAGDCSPSTIGVMLIDAQEMGRLQERMWWRSGVDPKTGRRREELAISGKKQTKVLDDHRNRANAVKVSNADRRRELVARIAQSSHRTGGSLEEYVERKLKEKHDIQTSRRTIRRDLDSLKKVGQTG